MGRIFKDLLAKEGIEESLEEIVNYMKISMHHALKHYEEKYHIDQSFIDKYQKQRKKVEIQLSKPFDGVRELCKYIYTSNKRNYLYTHRGESSIQLLQDYGLYDYFSEFITSKQTFERKPSPDAINYLVDKYNMVRTEAIMIGDREIDILSAKNAGIDGCFFTDCVAKSENADVTISQFGELYSIL